MCYLKNIKRGLYLILFLGVYIIGKEIKIVRDYLVGKYFIYLINILNIMLEI